MAYTLQQVMEMGVACDLLTVDEAVLNFELHAMQLCCYEDVASEVDNIRMLYNQYKANGGSANIPQDIVDKVNAEMDAAAAEWKDLPPPTDFLAP